MHTEHPSELTLTYAAIQILNNTQVQVMQLPGHLAAAAFVATGATLDTCLAHLPPCLHRHACAAAPHVITQGSLRVDASSYRWTKCNMKIASFYDPVHRVGGEIRPEGCVANSVVLCALLKAAADFPHLHGLHLDVIRDDGCTSERCAYRAESALIATLRCTLATLSQLKALSLGGDFANGRISSGVKHLLPKLPLEEVSLLGTESRRVALDWHSVAAGEASGPSLGSARFGAWGGPHKHRSMVSQKVKPVLGDYLARCTGLTSLQLRCLREPSDSTDSGRTFPLAQLLQSLPLLQHFTLAEIRVCKRRAASLRQGLVSLTRLRSLNMRGCIFRELSDLRTSCYHPIPLLRTLAALSTLVCASTAHHRWAIALNCWGRHLQNR